MAERVEGDARVEEQLALLDENPSVPVDPTLKNLHRELETLADDLRSPVSADPYEAERSCHQAVERVRSLAAEPSASASAISPGDSTDLVPGMIFGQYKILAKLGQGGMGAVYKALHTRLDKIVALKVLPAGRVAQAAAVARFQREMKAVGKIDHPHLVRASDAGEADGVHYLVMEYVDGIDLAQVSKRHGALPVAAACELIRQAALGVQAAHQHGMVHRDIKPANLMLARQEFGSPVVKVLDLGLALLAGGQETETGLTSADQIMGTIDYMAPEQAGDSHAVDTRVDIYSLGASLFALLTGRPPYHGNQYQTRMQKLRALAVEPIPALRTLRPEVPEALAAVLDQMLARERDQRYATATAVVAALAPFAAGADLAGLLDEVTGSETASVANRATGMPARRGEVAATVDYAPPLASSRTDGRSVPPPQRSRARTLRFVAAAAFLALVPLAWFSGGTIVRFASNQGELIVEVEDKDVEVKIVLDGVEVEDTKNKRRFLLKSGKGAIEVTEQDGIKLVTRKFELTRGGTTTVTVTWQDLAEARKKGEPKVAGGVIEPHVGADGDRKAAEYVLSIGGVLRVNNQRLDIRRAADLPTEAFRLSYLGFFRTPVDDAGLALFKDCLALRHLDLNSTSVSDAGLAHFKDCKDLSHLNLTNTRVSDAGLAYFKDCKNLSYLGLWKTRVSDVGLAHLKDCKNLTVLNLEFTQVSDAGLAYLKDCKSLQTLKLDATSIGDPSIEVLRGFTQLTLLSVKKTKLTEAGVKKVAAGLPGCTIEWDGGVIEPKTPADPGPRFKTQKTKNPAWIAHRQLVGQAFLPALPAPLDCLPNGRQECLPHGLVRNPGWVVSSTEKTIIFSIPCGAWVDMYHSLRLHFSIHACVGSNP